MTILSTEPLATLEFMAAADFEPWKHHTTK